jgi:lysophospholipase L1-like esterase
MIVMMICGLITNGCGGSNRAVSVPATQVKANANIAFMGDSITSYWTLPTTNLGVPGDTTAQMLSRFQAEVIGHGYKTVVILAGTNDVRNENYTAQEETAIAIPNIEQMASLGAAAKMTVVLCSIPPILNLPGRAEVLNAEIVRLAKAHGYLYVDYFTPLNHHPEYFKDNLHPNAQGYDVMQVALEGVISIYS